MTSIQVDSAVLLFLKTTIHKGGKNAAEKKQRTFKIMTDTQVHILIVCLSLCVSVCLFVCVNVYLKRKGSIENKDTMSEKKNRE